MHHGPIFSLWFLKKNVEFLQALDFFLKCFFGCQEAKVEVTAPPNYAILDELFGLDQAGAWSNESRKTIGVTIGG
jgi:hypothetical protein